LKNHQIPHFIGNSSLQLLALTSFSSSSFLFIVSQDTGGVRDFSWTKISDSDPQQRWSTPICHGAGGGDNVLVVQDGFLTTRALSRWKRTLDADGAPQLASKRLRAVRGQVQFLVAPDGSKAVVLEEDV